jgi:DUF438 domain-containing protein
MKQLKENKMSELINNGEKRKELLKHMILELHKGAAPEAIRNQIGRVMGEVPYDTVVEIEQELMAEGLPFQEILKMCDIHSAALKGKITEKDSKTVPAGHPVDTFKEENRALLLEIYKLRTLLDSINAESGEDSVKEKILAIQMHFNNLSDVDKHYRRKENLLFPFLEKHGIDGPPKVMWGKHDQTRALLKSAIENLRQLDMGRPADLVKICHSALHPAIDSIEEMINKEEAILLPMSLDVLSDEEWYQVYSQSLEVGYCLIDPKVEWAPQGIETMPEKDKKTGDRIQLPSGSFTISELEAIFNTIPFDLTFVDAGDTVRYFTQGRERIFERNRAVLGRKVQLCHPPKSAWIVQQILDDFRSGGEDRAPFWIEMGGKFIHIEYFALRGKDGKYLGTLEVTQDITEKRQLDGEQRLLNYVKDWKS